VAEEGSALIGTVIGGFDGRRGLVYHLAVACDQRSRGIGTALMNELESRLTAKGCHKCYLLVADDNLDAVDYYRQRGWEKMNVQVMGKVLR
jgi:ribosomal protein S18 acetylase RimI-like enzyme